jgi:hypothetical protein
VYSKKVQVQSPWGFVKREAGGIPALSRSGDGNERRPALSGNALFREGWEAAIE